MISGSKWLARVSVALLVCVGVVSPAVAQRRPASAVGSQASVEDPPAPVAPAVISRGENGRVVVRATRLAQPLKIDGRLDEAVYSTVPAITDFIQTVPAQGQPSTEKTEAWVFFDDNYLYVTGRMYEDVPPEQWTANELRRDTAQLRQNDMFGFLVDTFHDRRNGFNFYVNPLGGFADQIITDEGNPNVDWNPVWEVRTGRFDGGWTAELAVPFKSLRYNAGKNQTWGLQLRRSIRRKNEWTHLTPVPASSGGATGIFRVSAAGTLVGLDLPPAGKNVEVKPYAISKVTSDVAKNVSNDVEPNAGVDAKIGITANLTADLTVNTDFAQVEVDEQQLNLTRFSLQFPEKRDFFLEGQGMFQFGAITSSGNSSGGGSSDAPTIFYSRRIGLSNGVVIPIIAGGRLSGKAGKWSLGALNIASKADTTAKVPLTDFTVLRARRDVLGRSTLGVMVANRSQSVVASGANTLVGVDGNFSFFQNVYLSGYVAATSTPTRDAEQASYRGNFGYGSDRYGFSLDRMVVDRNFNPEIGFVPRQNVRRTFASARFSPRPRRNRIVRRVSYEGGYNYETDNTNRLESREVRGDYRVELQNSDVLTVEATRNYELLRKPLALASNVGVPAGSYGFSHLRTSMSLGQQHRLSGVAAFDTGQFYDGTKQTASLNARYGFTRQLGVEPNVSLNWVERAGTSALIRATGARATFTVTPRMFVSALVQYSSSGHALSTNFRFRWEYQPGSELFVVYTDGRDTAAALGAPTLQNRGIVIKANRLFRL